MNNQRLIALIALAMSLVALAVALSGCATRDQFTERCRNQTLSWMQGWNPHLDGPIPEERVNKLWFVNTAAYQRRCEENYVELVNRFYSVEEIDRLRKQARQFVRR